MSSDDIAVDIYPDLSDADAFLFNWRPHFTFVPDANDPGQCAALAQLGGVSVHFPVDGDCHEPYLEQLLIGGSRSATVVAMEGVSSPRSRVRSYKGLLAGYPTIAAGQHQQLEKPFAPPWTHLAVVARVAPANVAECMALGADGNRSFLLLTAAPIASLRELGDVVLSTVPGLPGPAYLNYAPLLASVCMGGAWLVRMGGYSGDGDADVQVFAPRDELEDVVRAMGLEA